jgi:hypothetical protein
MKNTFYLISLSLLLLNGCSLFQNKPETSSGLNKPTEVKQATVNNDDIKNALQDAKNQISNLENRIKVLESKGTTAASIETVGTCPIDFFDIGGGYCREIKCGVDGGDSSANKLLHVSGKYCIKSYANSDIQDGGVS